MKQSLYLPLSKLFINQVVLDQANESKVEIEKQKHIFYDIDVSASMYSALPQLKKHLKENFPTYIKPKDKVAICWFSSNNECEYVLEDFEIKDQTSLKAFNNAIDLLQDQSLTGFRDPLQKNIDSIKKFKKENPNTVFIVVFMSDGWENQNSKSTIEKLLDELALVADSTVIVEYGKWADHDFLVNMAKKTNGQWVYADQANDYNNIINSVQQNSFQTKVMKTIELDKVGDIVFGLTANNEIIGVEHKEGIVYYPEGLEKIIYLSNELPKDTQLYDEISLTTLYAVAYESNKLSLSKLRHEILLTIGDKYLVEQSFVHIGISKAKEYSTLLLNALQNPSERFKNGKYHTNNISMKKMTMLEVFYLLINNNENQTVKNRFCPQHKSFEYKKLSLPKKQASALLGDEFKDYQYELKFNDYDNQEFEFNESMLTFNSEKARLSLKVNYKGFVDTSVLKNDIPYKFSSKEEKMFEKLVERNLILDNDKTFNPNTYYKLNVGSIVNQKIDTTRFATYTIINDGIVDGNLVGLRYMPVKLNESTFNTLKYQGYIKDNFYDENLVYVLDLKEIPVVDFFDIQSLCLKDIANISLELIKTRLEYNTVNYYIDRLFPKKVQDTDTDTDVLLKLLGIKDSFNPKTVQMSTTLQTTDWISPTYNIVTKPKTLPTTSALMEDKGKGSKFNAIDDFFEKNTGKKPNMLEEILYKHNKKYINELGKFLILEAKGDKDVEQKKEEFLKNSLKEISKRKRELEYQMSKYVMIFIIGQENYADANRNTTAYKINDDLEIYVEYKDEVEQVLI